MEPTSSERILGKRANRGYNPKYDSKQTQFLTKGKHPMAQDKFGCPDEEG